MATESTSRSGGNDGGPRFRVELFQREGYDQWDAVVYDLADHGPDLPYASVTAPSLPDALAQTASYLLAASDPTSGLPPDLARVLRDPSIVVSQDQSVWEALGRWANAPSNTASAPPTEGEA